MKILVWAATPNLELSKEKTKYLLNTANYYCKNIEIELMGVEYRYRFLKDKIYILKKHIEQFEDDELILCIDGFDTLMNKSMKEVESDFYSFNTEIVISSEQFFTYQWGSYQDKFESIQSRYKYVNSGTIIGKVKHIKNMINEIFIYPEFDITEIDQGLIGMWVYKNIDDNKKVKLDSDCKITWVTSNDYDELNIQSDKNEVIKNPYTNTIPFIIHAPGNESQYNNEIYIKAYNSIIKRI